MPRDCASPADWRDWASRSFVCRNETWSEGRGAFIWADDHCSILWGKNNVKRILGWRWNERKCAIFKVPNRFQQSYFFDALSVVYKYVHITPFQDFMQLIAVCRLQGSSSENFVARYYRTNRMYFDKWPIYFLVLALPNGSHQPSTYRGV
jgi:hypothetical protein